jgi:hypothetical protein
MSRPWHVADGVHAVVQPVEAADAQPVRDVVGVEAGNEKLRSTYDAVLARGQRRDEGVGTGPLVG